VRRFTAVLVGFALCLAFVEAPFLHVHRHEATQRHTGALLHLHLRFAHSLSNRPEVRNLDPDDDAQLQNWFAATSTESPATPVILAEAHTILVLEFSGWTVHTRLPNGRDPPLLNVRNPRAPPA